jgi:4-amino-4-deoxy-L-arabinose transferase-like glycosyltransferase
MDPKQYVAKGDIFLYVFLGVFALGVYVAGLFPETTVDSAKYASVSRNIFENGDFIHLNIHGEPYLQKPPLLFWLAAVFFRIFGISMFAFKLPNLLFSFLGIYSTYRLGCLIYDKRTGIIAAVIYSTSEALFLYSMDVHTDLLLTSNIIFGTWQLAEFISKRRVHNFILGFTGVGLAMISKGVIGLIVPVISIAGFLIMKKDYRTLFSIKWLAGVPVLLLILYPTLKGLYDQFGSTGLEFYFWSNNIDRVRGVYTSGGHDYFFYFHTLAYLFLPWALFAYTAFIKDLRIWWNRRLSILNVESAYCYSPVIFLAIIICSSSQQSPHYLLPTIPFVSILTAGLIKDVAFDDLYPRTYKLMLIFRTIIVALIWFLAFIMIVYFFPTRNLLIWIPVLLLFVLIIYSYLRLKSKIQKLIIPALISILALSFVANIVYMPSALKYHGPIQASYLYNRLANDDSKLYTYDYSQFETYFYPKNVSSIVYKEQLKGILANGHCWFITSEKGYTEIKSFNESIILEKYVFPYKKLTNISLKFLNPKTRESSLTNMYLLKIRG